MSRTEQRPPEVVTTFSQPIRAIANMLMVCLMVGAGAWLILAEITDILRVSPYLNGLISFVFVIGVLTCFWQVWILAQSVYWIENFVRGTPGTQEDSPPRLLATLATLLRSHTARLSMSSLPPKNRRHQHHDGSARENRKLTRRHPRVPACSARCRSSPHPFRQTRRWT